MLHHPGFIVQIHIRRITLQNCPNHHSTHIGNSPKLRPQPTLEMERKAIFKIRQEPDFLGYCFYPAL